MDAIKIPRRQQQGFVLIITLVILVVITLSSLAMMLSTRAGVSASGNIAFRQAAVRVADVAVEQGFQWIATALGVDGTALDADNLPSGYYASFNAVDAGCVPAGVTTFSPVSYDFAQANCAVTLASQVSGYSLRYVIHRMAAAAGVCPGAGCMNPGVTAAAAAATGPGAGGSQESGAGVFGAAGTAANNKVVYYRITVKVAGPRRNNRFIQAFVY